jgi:two-component system chemotaxis sensor kinase CheA
MMQFSDAERAELLATFRAQAAELLVALEEGLLTLERAPQDEEALHAVFRAAHTIKGDARIVGFEEVALAAHALEDVLEQLRERTLTPVPGLISALLAVGDALRGMIQQGHRPEHQVALDVLALSAEMARSEAPEHAADVEATNSTTQSAAQAQSRTLRVDVGKLDRMLDLAGEIAIARGFLTRMLEQVPGALGVELLEAHREADRLHFELQEQVMKARMVPIGPFLKQFARPLREICNSSGKRAELTIEGGDVEVDTRVLELLRDAVGHMLRNAVDHGLEDPELRAALGKPMEGRITLAASHEGGLIILRLQDDGAGFDLKRIADRARLLGLVADPSLLPRHELLKVVFAPGFSTADQVTDLSGRGVGMDVVRRNVEALRGSIELSSEDGAGSCVTIRLPLTLAIIEGFSVGVGADTYVLPLHAVRECLALPAERHEDGKGCGVFDLRGAPLPYLRLRDQFALGGQAPRREHVVVVTYEGGTAGLVVDELHGEGQAVIKSLGRVFQGIAGLAGSTILNSGRVALILDVPVVVRQAQMSQVDNQPVLVAGHA